MWNRRKRCDVSASLRSLRRRILDEGSTLFRVIGPGFDHRDFVSGPDAPYCSDDDAKKAAFHYALDLASLSVGQSMFVSERRELDGVQILVKASEVCWELGVCDGK